MRTYALLLLPALALGACSKDEKKKPEEVAEPTLGSGKAPEIEDGKDKPSVVVTLSVDWEGAYLSPDGLSALAEFREKWTGVPLTHFICPAYFAHGGDLAKITETIKAHILEGDEVGLHVHSWESLTKLSGIPFRETPNFYGDDSELKRFENGDRGYEVRLSAYSPEELTIFINGSLELMKENGLGTPTSFRAGGYTTSPEILQVIRNAGILVDSSSAWSTWFEEGQGGFQSELARTWPNLQELTQPYGIDTKAGPVIEVPNSGSFVEYVSTDEMLGHLQRAAAASQERGKPMYVNFGVHQESADEFIEFLSKAIEYFNEDSPGIISFSTVTKVAHEAMQD